MSLVLFLEGASDDWDEHLCYLLRNFVIPKSIRVLFYLFTCYVTQTWPTPGFAAAVFNLLFFLLSFCLKISSCNTKSIGSRVTVLVNLIFFPRSLFLV